MAPSCSTCSRDTAIHVLPLSWVCKEGGLSPHDSNEAYYLIRRKISDLGDSRHNFVLITNVKLDFLPEEEESSHRRSRLSGNSRLSSNSGQIKATAKEISIHLLAGSPENFGIENSQFRLAQMHQFDQHRNTGWRVPEQFRRGQPLCS